MTPNLKKIFSTVGLIFVCFLMLQTHVFADGVSTFKKNRIKQLSEHSDRYNYYEEKNNRVKRGSKSIGMDARDVKGYGTVHNWVEIENSKVGNITSSVTKRFRSANPFHEKSKNADPDRNLGILANGKTNKQNLDNTVIVKGSKVENAVFGADVNSGIIIQNSRAVINGKTYENNVNIEKSRLGGAAGLFQ